MIVFGFPRGVIDTRWEATAVARAINPMTAMARSFNFAVSIGEALVTKVLLDGRGHGGVDGGGLAGRNASETAPCLSSPIDPTDYVLWADCC